jgi:hypothetical protein
VPSAGTAASWLLPLLVAACSHPVVSAPVGPAAAPAPQGFSISARPPRVGETTHERVHSWQKVTLTTGAEQRPPRANDTTSTYDDTIDAVAGLAVTRVKALVTQTVTDASFPSWDKLRVVAAAEDGHVVLRDETGALLGEPYAHELGDHYRILGRPEPFLAHVPVSPLRPGERVPEYEQALSDRFRRESSDAEGRLVEAHVEVLEADAGKAVAKLAWKARLVGKQFGFALEGTLQGTIRVRRDGLLDHIDYRVDAHGQSAGGVEVAIESSEEHDYSYDAPGAGGAAP